jgi:hypothetical protein
VTIGVTTPNARDYAVNVLFMDVFINLIRSKRPKADDGKATVKGLKRKQLQSPDRLTSSIN